MKEMNDPGDMEFCHYTDCYEYVKIGTNFCIYHTKKETKMKTLKDTNDEMEQAYRPTPADTSREFDNHITDNMDDPMRHNIGGSMNRPVRNEDPLSSRNIEHNHIEEVLQERGDRYGDFKDHAYLTQKFKEIMRTGVSWKKCSPSQKQALETIADKIARIINGDPDYDDSWTDIIGYSQLVLNQLNKA